MVMLGGTKVLADSEPRDLLPLRPTLPNFPVVAALVVGSGGISSVQLSLLDALRCPGGREGGQDPTYD
jgi:hypothetical protein